MNNQVVVLTLAEESYGVDIAVVAEIIKLQPVTFVPRAPAFVEGVTNLRGKVLPVIDLRKRFGLPVAAASKQSRIVVVEIGGALVGMVVDAVSEVLRVPEGAVEPPSPLVTTVDSAFISGIAKVGSRLIILLDLEQVLDPAEKTALRQVLQPDEGLSGEAGGQIGSQKPEALLPPAQVPPALPGGEPEAAEEAKPAVRPRSRKKKGEAS